ncbi:MAG: leucine/isoleucine/valine transporter permease subunit [bacterium]|nr:leucine/isoleucine/valine transporter permease subunit [bacterium]
MTPVDLRRTLRWGSLAGAVMVFTCAVGLFEAFEDRLLVYPFLSLGHVLLLWFLPLAGYQATNEPVLEGMEAPSKGLHNVMAGLAAGLAGGVLMGVFTVVVDAFDVRDVFVRLSVRLVDLLTHGWGVPGGLVLIVGVPALLGMAGGMLHLVSASVRRRMILALEWALVVALLEQVFSQVLRQLRLGAVGNIIFTRRALEWWAALAIAVLVAFLAERARGGVGRLRGYLFAADAVRRTRNSIWSALAVLAFLVILPQLLGSLLSELLANVGLFLLMGLGLNIVVGLAGMLDLGYVAFFAVGAYTVGVLTSPISPRFDLEWSWWAALPVAILMSVVAGVLVGTPVIRMRGDYLAIVTLGFGEIVRILFLSDWLAPVFGGAQGVRNVPGIPVGVVEVRGSQPVGVLYFAFGLVLVAAWVSWALQESRLGRAWTAIREDETVAAAMGINVVRAKLNAFIVGAILAGLGGALFAAKVGSIFPSSFELLVSIIVLVVVIVGGMGNIPGVAVGAVLLIGVLGGPTQPGLLAEFAEFKLLIYGALLVFMMLRKPEGLLPSVRRSRELRGEELSQDAWLDRPSGDVEVDARLAGG